MMCSKLNLATALLLILCFYSCGTQEAKITKEIAVKKYEASFQPLLGEWNLVFHLDEKHSKKLSIKKEGEFIVCHVDDEKIELKIDNNQIDFTTTEASYSGKQMGRTIWGKLKMNDGKFGNQRISWSAERGH